MVEESRPIIAPTIESSDTLRQSASGLDISETNERQLMFEKMFEEANMIGNPARDLYDNVYSKIKNEPSISADEANQKYSVPGQLYFDKPIPESVARARQQRSLKALERDRILSSERVDNTPLQSAALFGSGALAVTIFDPINWINPTNGFANFLKMGAVAKTLGKAGVPVQYLNMADELLRGTPSLASAVKYGKNTQIAAGAARAAIDIGLPNLAEELWLHDTAINNGYDYDVASAAAYGFGMTGLAGLAGGLAGNALYKSVYKNFDTLKGIMNMDQAATKIIGDTFAMIDRAGDLAKIDSDVFSSLITKHTSDLISGRLPSLETTRALIAYSGHTKEISDFLSNLKAGKYAGIIDDATAKLLTVDDIRGLNKTDFNFKAWVMSSIDDLGSGEKLYRSLIDSNVLQKYAGKITNVKQVGDLIVNLKTQIGSLTTELRKLQADTANSTRSFKLKGELKGKIKTLKSDIESLQSYKSKTQLGKLDDFVSRTQKKDYTQTSSDVFRADYKKIVKRIKDRKMKSPAQWMSLSDKGREDLYKLYDMVDPRLFNEPSLDDLLKFSDEDLIAMHQVKILEKELSPMSREDAYKILKDEMVNPEARTIKAAEQKALTYDTEIQNSIKLNEMESSALSKELEVKLKNEKIKNDPEIKKVLDDYDKGLEKFKKDTLVDQKAFECLGGIL